MLENIWIAITSIAQFEHRAWSVTMFNILSKILLNNTFDMHFTPKELGQYNLRYKVDGVQYLQMH